MSELVFDFRVTTRERVTAAARALLMIPALSDQSFARADLAYAAHARTLTASLRFDPERFADAPRDRVTFWCARAGGLLAHLRHPSPVPFDLVLPGVDAGELVEAVERISAAAGHPMTLSAPVAPVLALNLGGPATAGVAYDAATRRLFVPAPLTLPVGDGLVLEVVLPPPAARRARAFVRVTDVRARSAAAPGHPAGVTLAVDPDADGFHSALATTLSPQDPQCSRAAPRLPAAAPVRVRGAAPIAADAHTAAAVPGSLRDISHRGAFIRTSSPAPIGSRIRVSLPLPDGSDFEATATVAHVTREGMGVEFRLDSDGESLLAGALASVTGRSHRVLVVDDDALARRMLTDVFALRGVDVLTAPDADEGLRVLADEILTLDALVTDVHMPGIDGEAFVRTIRGAGGEHELPIVVATASLDDADKERLRRAGANEVVVKTVGPELIVETTIAAIRSRRAGPPQGSTVGPGREHARAASARSTSPV